MRTRRQNNGIFAVILTLVVTTFLMAMAISLAKTVEFIENRAQEHIDRIEQVD